MKYLQAYLATWLIAINITFLILDTNVFEIGYSFLDYVQFISRKVEVYLFIPGMILLIRAQKKGKQNENHKRHSIKFR